MRLAAASPADGSYKINGRCYALDNNGTGTTTDICILENSEQVGAFVGKIDHHGGVGSASFTSKVFPPKGNTFDFEVGFGADKNYEYARPAWSP